jgi:hypothetical protein
MIRACLIEEFEAAVIKIEQSSAHLPGILGGTSSVLGVVIIAQPAGIMQNREQFDYLEAAIMCAGDLDCITLNTLPVVVSVY